MHICFITNKYPNIVEPNVIVFLQQLVSAIAAEGIKCTVICPVQINVYPRLHILPKLRVDHYMGNNIEVYFPRYFGLGMTDFLGYNPALITTYFFEKAVDKVLSGLKDKPDYLYGHFITPAGITCARLGRKYKIPAFFAYGEATYMTIEAVGKKRVKRELTTISGVIAVSSQNKEMISEFVPQERVEVFPNSIDNTVFYPRNRHEARKKYNIDPEQFIVSFVGSFDDRKGINRLCEAIDRFNGEVKVICAGKGKLVPTSENCIYKDAVLHDDLPLFLSASDVFVLPTRNEGCCNAIIEAIACGLPIVSSDKSFNDDILDESNSIRINPDDVDAIYDAINQLKSNTTLREKLHNGSLERAKALTLKERAKRILAFMENKND